MKALAASLVLTVLAFPVGAQEKSGPLTDPLSRSFLLPSREYFATPSTAGLPEEPVSFPNLGGKQLRGWFMDHPGTEKTVLVCMGNMGNISVMLPYARFLHQGGFDVLLFDYQGFGKSGGLGSVLSLYGDAQSAFGYLTREKKKRPEDVGVLGVSRDA